MAEKKPEADDGMGGAPKKKGKLLLFIIIGVLVVVLGAGGAFFAMKKKPAAEDEDAAADDGTAKVVKKVRKDHPDAPPVFVKFEPFTVKLQSDGQQQEAYLQTTPELRVVDAPTGERVKQYTPEIRHKVLLLLSGKKPSELGNPQGVQRLSNEIRDAINVIIDGPKKRQAKAGEEAAGAESSDRADPDDSVQAVLFTSFIIQ